MPTMVSLKPLGLTLGSTPYWLIRDVPNVDLVQTGLGILLDIDIYGEMCVDVTHLIFEAARNTDDEVVN